MSDYVLVVVGGSQSGQQYPMGKETFTIGREEGNTIILDDGSISRHHARITWQAEELLIEDLDSANGIWVNDVRISVPTSLKPGDSIQVGLEAGLRLETKSSIDPTLKRPIEATLQIDPTTRPTIPTDRASNYQFCLIIQSGQRAGQTIPLHTGRYTIGQAPSSVIRFPDPGVSPNHALIVMQEEGIWIQDQESTQGTQINQQAISQSTWLNPGDLIGFGEEVTLIFEEDPKKATTFVSPVVPIPLSQALKQSGAGEAIPSSTAPPQASTAISHGTPTPESSSALPHAASGASGPEGPQAGGEGGGSPAGPQTTGSDPVPPATPTGPDSPTIPVQPPPGPGSPSDPGGPGGPGGPNCLLTSLLTLMGLGIIVVGGYLILNFLGIPLPFLPDTNPPPQVILIQVPNIVGMDEIHATATLLAVGLTSKVETIPLDENAKVDIGMVFAQQPPAGSAVEKDSTVIIQIPVLVEEDDLMPKLIDTPTATLTQTHTLTPSATIVTESYTVTPTQSPTITPTTTTTSTLTTAPSDIPCNKALWKADITIPDDTQMTPGQEFTKVWEVENAGTCDWDVGYRLIFKNGSFGQNLSPYQFTTLEVKAGDRVQISIKMTAPLTPGVQESHWTMRSSTGEVFSFGQEQNATLYTRIEVVSTPTITPTIR